MKIYGEGGDPRVLPPTPLEHRFLVDVVRHNPGSDSTGNLESDDPRLKASKANKNNDQKGGDKT